jgi:uncharacterized protein DUF3738
MLIKTAYGVHDDQIVGGPEWIDTARFDLTAKAADTTPSATAFRDQARLMLRRALEDRFNLALVRDRREIPVYALVISKSDGRLGSQLVRSGWADRLVVDRTRLSGRFDWDLQWTQAALSAAPRIRLGCRSPRRFRNNSV